jgi:hypothetical protein
LRVVCCYGRLSLRYAVRCCALCGEERQLRLSHLLPAGVYGILRSPTRPGEPPVLITPRVSILTDAEVRAHLLCDEHEQRFNRKGEDWTLENCWRGSNEF